MENSIIKSSILSFSIERRIFYHAFYLPNHILLLDYMQYIKTIKDINHIKSIFI